MPFAVVTDGRDLELLDTSTEKIRVEGFDSIPDRKELAGIAEQFVPRSTKKKKLADEQRVLYICDAITCPSNRCVIP